MCCLEVTIMFIISKPMTPESYFIVAQGIPDYSPPFKRREIHC